MTSINLLIIELILCFIILIISYKQYQIKGLYIYSVIALFISCIMSIKTITINNYDINLGIIPFMTIFTANNIIIQKKGSDEVKPLILTLISTTLFFSIILYLVSLMSSSKINLFTNASYDNILINSPRIIFSNIVTTLYSLILNSKLYYYLKRVKNNILISNLFSNIIIQFISSILFGFVTYLFTKDIIDIIKIIMIRYLICLIIGLFSTVVIYISNYIKEK